MHKHTLYIKPESCPSDHFVGRVGGIVISNRIYSNNYSTVHAQTHTFGLAITMEGGDQHQPGRKEKKKQKKKNTP